jgi:hypothetical protein
MLEKRYFARSAPELEIKRIKHATDNRRVAYFEYKYGRAGSKILKIVTIPNIINYIPNWSTAFRNNVLVQEYDEHDWLNSFLVPAMRNNYMIEDLIGNPPINVIPNSAGAALRNEVSLLETEGMNPVFLRFLQTCYRFDHENRNVNEVNGTSKITIREMNIIKQKMWWRLNNNSFTRNSININSKLFDNLRLAFNFIRTREIFHQRTYDYLSFRLDFDLSIFNGRLRTNFQSVLQFFPNRNRTLFSGWLIFNSRIEASHEIDIDGQLYTMFRDSDELLEALNDCFLDIVHDINDRYDLYGFNTNSYDIVSEMFEFKYVFDSLGMFRVPLSFVLDNNDQLALANLLTNEWFSASKLPPLYNIIVVPLTFKKVRFHANKDVRIWIDKSCFNRAIFVLFFLSDENLSISTFKEKASELGIINKDYKYGLKTLIKDLDVLFDILDSTNINFGLVIVSADWFTITQSNCDEEIIVILFEDVADQKHIEVTTKDLWDDLYRRLRKNILSRFIANNEKCEGKLKNYGLKKKFKKKDEPDYEFEEVYFDIETFTFGNRDCYLVCCIYEVDKKEVFKNIKEFMDWLLNKPWSKKNIHLWSHNGAKFDLIYLLPFVGEAKILGDIHNIKQMRIDYNGKVFKTFDLFLTFPNSLKSLSKMFNTEHSKLDQELMLNITNEQDVLSNWEELCKYCYHDCLVLKEIIIKFRDSLLELNIEIPNCWVSTASLANSIFVQNYMDNTIYGLLFDEYHIFQRSYFGGFTTVLTPSMSKGYCYDINSSYPSVMVGRIPVINKMYGYPKLINFLEDELVNVDLNFDNNEGTIRFFHITSWKFNSDIYLSPFPVRKNEGNFYMLNGEDLWVWDHILNWIKNNPVFSFKYSIKLDKYYEFGTDYIYRNYVDFFYERKNKFKKENNDIQASLSKILLNSLYGKTGQKEFGKTIVTNINNLKEKLEDKSTILKIDSMKKLDEDNVLIKYNYMNIHPRGIGSLIYIANYITSKARLKLFEMIYDIIYKFYGKVYYVDTDSIFCDIELPKEYVSETELGLWKMEYPVVKARFFGSKAYVIQIHEDKINEDKRFDVFKTRFKGIPAKYLPEPNVLMNWSNVNYEDKLLEIDTTWSRQFGFVSNKPLKKKIRRTLNRRIFDFKLNCSFNL